MQFLSDMLRLPPVKVQSSPLNCIAGPLDGLYLPSKDCSLSRQTALQFPPDILHLPPGRRQSSLSNCATEREGTSGRDHPPKAINSFFYTQSGWTHASKAVYGSPYTPEKVRQVEPTCQSSLWLSLHSRERIAAGPITKVSFL